MAIQITHVRYQGWSKTHESIVRYQWRNDATGAVGDNDKPSMVSYIDDNKGSVYVQNGGSRVAVATVHPANSPAYLRTHADGKWTDNLLALPTF